MPVVTRDTASGKWFPASTAEMTSLVGGRSSLTGLAAAVVGIYNCQDASGDIVDATGTQNLTANAGGGTFRNAVTGYTRLAVRPTTGGAYSWANGLGPAGDTGTTSQVFLAHIHEYSAQSSDRDVISFQAGGGARGIVYTGGEKLKYVTNDASAVITGTANPSGGRWVLLQTDRTNNFNGVRTDQETLQQSPNTNPSAVANYVLVGASISNGAFVDLLWMLTARGSGSELTSTGWAQLLDALNNGPAVSSISVTSSSFAVNPTATQQLTATATRFDTSTYDATSTATWTSSNTAVATVSAMGLVTGVAAGTCTITATFTSLGASAASGTSACTVSGTIPTVPLPVVGVDVPDHQALALARLPEQDKNKPNIAALLNVAVTPAVALESALWQLLTQRFVTTAVGTNLDALGKLVGQPRNGLSDVDYQTYIAARISANRSSGLIEDLLRVAKTLIGSTAAVITASYGGPGTVVIRVTGVTRTDAQGAALASFLQTAIAAGIRVLVIYTTATIATTFRYDIGPGYDNGHYATGIG